MSRDQQEPKKPLAKPATGWREKDSASAHGPSLYALAKAKTILGQYPKGQATDPEIYCGSVAAILDEYPQAVVERVVDPRTGIARTLKFLPSIAEIGDCCEAEMAPIRRENARRKLEEDRRRMLGEPQEDRSKRKFYDQIVAECRATGESVLMIGPQGRGRESASAKEVADLKGKYGISDADWDAVPDPESSKHGTVKPDPDGLHLIKTIPATDAWQKLSVPLAPQCLGERTEPPLSPEPRSSSGQANNSSLLTQADEDFLHKQNP